MELTEMRDRCIRAVQRSRGILQEARERAERARELIAQCRNTRHTIALQRALARRLAGKSD